MWGISLGEYAVYWIGMGVVTVVAVVIGIIRVLRGKE